MSVNNHISIDLDNTLEDGAWLDSFDKLLEPRPFVYIIIKTGGANMIFFVYISSEYCES